MQFHQFLNWALSAKNCCQAQCKLSLYILLIRVSFFYKQHKSNPSVQGLCHDWAGSTEIRKRFILLVCFFKREGGHSWQLNHFIKWQYVTLIVQLLVLINSAVQSDRSDKASLPLPMHNKLSGCSQIMIRMNRCNTRLCCQILSVWPTSEQGCQSFSHLTTLKLNII